MTYQITSDTWRGYIEIEFDALGYMVRTDLTNAELTENAHRWFLNKMPRELAGLTRVIEGTSAKLTEIKKEVTFDDIWNRYDLKIRSSKKKSLAVWNRMNSSQRQKCFDFIKKYEANIPAGVPKKNFETYLNAEQWNN